MARGLRRVPHRVAVPNGSPRVSVPLQPMRPSATQSTRHLGWGLGGFALGAAMTGLAVANVAVWPLMQEAAAWHVAHETKSGAAITEKLYTERLTNTPTEAGYAMLARCSEVTRSGSATPLRVTGCASANLAAADVGLDVRRGQNVGAILVKH